MDNPRPEKVAVVDEVRQRLDGSQAAILTEYRGLTVGDMAELRRALSAAGGDYKVYKNTLVKLAVAGGRHEPLDALLEGPTAIAFVSGEVSAVAKALRDYARTNPSLIVKGGLHGEGFLSAGDLALLADLPPRDVLLSRFAGALAAPMQQLAGLLQAVPRSLAYGLSALLEQRGGTPDDGAQMAAETTEVPAPPETATAPEGDSASGETTDGAGAPEMAASEPDTATAEPDTATAEPDTATAEPDTATAEPGTATAEPEAGAEAATAEPEASAEAADTASAEAAETATAEEATATDADAPAGDATGEEGS
jgi:large subunit ribosomal protein L10